MLISVVGLIFLLHALELQRKRCAVVLDVYQVCGSFTVVQGPWKVVADEKCVGVVLHAVCSELQDYLLNASMCCVCLGDWALNSVFLVYIAVVLEHH